MSHLKGLAFVTAPTNRAVDPKLHRRERLIARIEEQRRLLKEPGLVIVDQRWVKGNDGVRRPIERPRKVRPWWRRTNDGKVVLLVRYGYRPLEFEKGKSGIELPSADGLDKVLSTLIAAVSEGELDQEIQRVVGRKADGAVKAK